MFERAEITLEIERRLDVARCGFLRLLLRLRRLSGLCGLRLGLNGSVSRHKVFANRALSRVHAEFGFKFVSSECTIRCADVRERVARVFQGVESRKIVLVRTCAEKNVFCNASCRESVLALRVRRTFHFVLYRALRVGIKRIEGIERTVPFRAECLFVHFALKRVAGDVHDVKSPSAACRIEIGDRGRVLRFNERRLNGSRFLRFREKSAFLLGFSHSALTLAFGCDRVSDVAFDRGKNRKERKQEKRHASRDKRAHRRYDFHKRIRRQA